MSKADPKRPALVYLRASIESCQLDIARRIRTGMELKADLQRNDDALATSRAALEDLEGALVELGG